MAYDEEQHRRSRIVVQTPAAEREVVQTRIARVPERRGVPAGVVAALVIGSVALVTVLFLFILNRQSNDTTVSTDAHTASTSQTPAQQPVIIQQPTPLPQQPIIVQPPAPTTSQPPVIVEQQPAPGAVAPSAPAIASKPGADDAVIQSEIDKKMSEDATLSTVGVTATVQSGKVTLIGTVDSQAIKNQVERLVKTIKGVKTVDDQIIVSAG